MKAISLWQPWASAMAMGLKKNETRSWPTKHRGDLVICSAKKILTEAEIKATNKTVFDIWKENLPYGFALCVVEVYDCIPTEFALGLSAIELNLGDYTPSRFVWITRNCRVLKEPIPIVGRQGIWNLSFYEAAKITTSLHNS